MTAIASSKVENDTNSSKGRGMKTPLGPKSLHRIAEVRRRQGCSIRSVARRTGIDARELRRQEMPFEDIKLSELYAWQQALEVPLTELLGECESQLAPEVRDRAQLVKIMKTIVALAEVVQGIRAKRMVQMLRDQMLELMPELKEIVGWPSFGTRRPSENMGKIGEHPISLRALVYDPIDDA